MSSIAPAGVVETLQDHWHTLLDGLKVTLELSVFGGAVAFVVAVVLGLAAISRLAVVRTVSRIIVEFFRGTSLVVQLFVLVYVLPQATSVGSHPLLFCVIALGLNYGAYGSEVVRGSLNAVPPGQWETTTALSMSWLTKIRRVIWPQAWALMLPGLNNLMVMLVKGTAIALFIGLPDLTSVGDDLRKSGVDAWTVYGISFVLYYLAALAFSAFLRHLEVRAQRRLGIRPSKVKTAQATAEAVA
ncbi:ectoine/hydroxyectoine ABC transporter permease subunit EhuC [Flexivirga endophytica]|uniref:Ectoine/hydroxyectoine ABC transporter permease subunit EhuC n=1 Tax=Flexivirga endophytica TaxID=1849103 RepID=A0A916WP09_9MICO|nr:ectoine/hydroxyectoine ABC transporter permease subunit EhuC [Flexivirga endophytica]GHB39531.1 ectoine/hydroxyectoine ABC transporter permease subunit EhuC [Flexivirga endophytica]